MIQSTLAPAPRKNRKAVERSFQFSPASAARDAVLGIFTGKLAVHYVVIAIPSEIGGKAFQLNKLSATEPEVYHVLLTEAGHVTCDCKGGTYCGHCKHGDSIKELAARGELPEPRPAILPGYDEWAASIYRTPPHPITYRDFEGEIAAAYGRERAA